MAIFITFNGLGPELFENINKLWLIQRLAQLNSVLFLLTMQNKKKSIRQNAATASRNIETDESFVGGNIGGKKQGTLDIGEV